MTKVTDNVTMLFLLVTCDLRLVTHDMTLVFQVNDKTLLPGDLYNRA